MNTTGGPPCPKCGARATQVKDSRSGSTVTYTNRRRLCGGCGHRFSTVEITKDEFRNLLRKAAFFASMKETLVEP